MTLYDRLLDAIEVDGKTFQLNPSFDRVLEALDVLRMDIGERFKFDRLCRLLIKGRVKPAWRKCVVTAALDELIEGKPSSEPRAFDFEQDARYIYAAFRQVYGINLFEQRGKLHWLEFIALFSALPKDARIVGIMHIRRDPVPAPTKHNAKQRAELIKQKRAFALHVSEQEAGQNYQSGLQKLASTILLTR